jgi:hypothetical protein
VFSTGWARDDVLYAAVDAKLHESGIGPRDVVIVRNPPGYFVRTGRSAILLPYGDESVLLAVAESFAARFLVLEKTNSLGAIQGLYDNPGRYPAFVYLGEVDGARLYRIVSVGP